MATSLPLKNKQLPLKLTNSAMGSSSVLQTHQQVHKTKGVAKSDGVLTVLQHQN
jgi:hypothetical protein